MFLSGQMISFKIADDQILWCIMTLWVLACCLYPSPSGLLHWHWCNHIWFPHRQWEYISYSYMLSHEYRMVRNDIHCCYSLVKIAFVPICMCKNNRWIWRHNANNSRLRDVTNQMWWCHNAKSEKIFLGDNSKMKDRWFSLTNHVFGT